MPHKEITLGPITNPHTRAHDMLQKLKHILLLMRHPTQQILCHAEVFPGITVDPDHMFITQTPPQNISKTVLTALTKQPARTKDRKHRQVTIDDPPSEYYSSDEPGSKSEDDLN